MVVNILSSSRVKVGILGATACSLVFSLRVNLSVAIVAMVNRTMIDERHPNDMCSAPYNETDSNDLSSGSLDWSESQQGIILGAYFYGFTATQIFGGRLAERWGAKWVCGIGIMIPAIINALSPLAAETHHILFIAIRIIIGAFHGLIYSSLFSMYAKWFPKQERTLAIAATLFGGNIGAVVMSPIAGYLCDNGFAGGWPSVFYVGSSIHLIWFIFWYFYAYDSPADHKSISPDEHLYILQNTDSQTNKSSAPAPWKQILLSKPVYASIFAKTSGQFGFYVLVTFLPSYFHSIFNLRITYSGLYTALLYLVVGIAFMIAGPLSAFIKNKSGFSLTRVRKTFQELASIGPAVCILLVPLVGGCNDVAILALFSTSMCLYGFVTGGEYIIIPEFAPEFTGTVFGFSNTFASATGFLAPIIVGIILDSDSYHTGTRKKWNLVFYITGAVYIVGMVFFEWLASAERQPWANLPGTLQINSGDVELNQTPNHYKKKISNKQLLLFHKKKIDTTTPEWIRFKKVTYVL